MNHSLKTPYVCVVGGFVSENFCWDDLRGQELPYIYMSGKAKAQHLMWFAEKHASYRYVLAQSYIYIYMRSSNM